MPDVAWRIGGLLEQIVFNKNFMLTSVCEIIVGPPVAPPTLIDSRRVPVVPDLNVVWSVTGVTGAINVVERIIVDQSPELPLAASGLA